MKNPYDLTDEQLELVEEILKRHGADSIADTYPGFICGYAGSRAEQRSLPPVVRQMWIDIAKKTCPEYERAMDFEFDGLDSEEMARLMKKYKEATDKASSARTEEDWQYWSQEAQELARQMGILHRIENFEFSGLSGNPYDLTDKQVRLIDDYFAERPHYKPGAKKDPALLCAVATRMSRSDLPISERWDWSTIKEIFCYEDFQVSKFQFDGVRYPTDEEQDTIRRLHYRCRALADDLAYAHQDPDITPDILDELRADYDECEAELKDFLELMNSRDVVMDFEFNG